MYTYILYVRTVLHFGRALHTGRAGPDRGGGTVVSLCGFFALTKKMVREIFGHPVKKYFFCII